MGWCRESPASPSPPHPLARCFRAEREQNTQGGGFNRGGPRNQDKSGEAAEAISLPCPFPHRPPPLFPVHPSFLPVVPEESVDSLSLSGAPLLFAPSPHLFEIRTFSEECALNEEQPGSASLQLLGRVFLV